MPQLALITGGTSGIGAEFARQLSSEGYDLVLVARDSDRLTQVANDLIGRFGIKVESIAADLSTHQGMEIVEKRLASTEHPVDLLINNAGFGASGGFVEIAPDTHESMIAVNCSAVVRLTHAAVAAMSGRGNGRIINVASVAAFTPALRSSGTYSATKAFVVSFTQSLAPSLARKGIKIAALCPGWVRSEFHKRAGINMAKVPNFMWLEPEEVVATALKDLKVGKTLIVPGTQYKILVAVIRLFPQSLMSRLVRLVGKRAH